MGNVGRNGERVQQIPMNRPTTAIASQQRTIMQRVLAAGVFGLACLAATYLIFKAIQVSEEPGYDFKFIWIAGEVWSRELSPYSDAYNSIARTLINQGHVPTIWAYPPNWWLPSILVAQIDLELSFRLWSLSSAALLLVTSIMLAQAYLTVFSAPHLNIPLLGPFTIGSWQLASLIFFASATLEATAIGFAAGQTGILVFFGIALLLWGECKKHPWACVAGLILIMLKPQLGIGVGLVYLLSGQGRWRNVFWGAALTVAMTFPAFWTDPNLLAGLLQNLRDYDGVSLANAPQAMTGLRLVAWALFTYDLHSALALAVGLVLTLQLCFGPWRIARAKHPGTFLWHSISICIAVSIAVLPLHYYDSVITPVLLFALISARRATMIVGVVGVLAIWRADQIGTAIGLYDPAVPIFEGSILATIGSLLLSVSTIMSVARWQDYAKPNSGVG